MVYHPEFKQWIAENQALFLKDLARIIRIPSKKSVATTEAPFGEANLNVLREALTIADEYGFSTKMVENAVGYAQLGEEEDYIGVVGHLDVVPEGEGWSSPPYELTLRDEKLYGRGVLDNKGPIMACLFALKLLQDHEVPLKRTVRIVFGTDEESGSQDMPLYLAKEKAPIFGFTPDCKYPVVYGERGILRVGITTKITADSFTHLGAIVGSQDPSFIPDSLTTVFQGRTFTASGKRSPSNAPELGENSITLLAKQLEQVLTYEDDLKDYLAWIVAHLHQQHQGEGLGLNWSDSDSGTLQISPYRWTKQDDGMCLEISIRYPVTVTEEAVLEQLTKVLPKQSTLNVLRRLPSTVFPKEHWGVQKLVTVYEEVMQEDGQPVTTTGATYARFVPNIVAFGPSFPGQKGIAHNPDEYMDLTDWLKNIEIYMHAILALAND